MHPILNRNMFFIKEHIGMFKAANNYDILDPETQETILHCREDNLGTITKLLRFTGFKKNTPFDIEIRTPAGEKVISIRRGISLVLSDIEVFDASDKLIGVFSQKLFSIGGKFNVLDAEEQCLCQLKGRWTSWDFKFIRDEIEFAHVSKKWAGLGKELFTSADNYMLSIDTRVPENSPLRMLILAAVMCIDMVLHE